MAAPHNPVTHLARLAKRKRRSSGDLKGARLRLWSALQAAEACLLDSAEAGDQGGVLKAVHAVVQATGAFSKLVEVGELEARLVELEGALSARTAASHTSTAGRYAGATA